MGRFAGVVGIAGQRDASQAAGELAEGGLKILADVAPFNDPMAGVISAVHVVPGQVVEAREILFEIVDPERLAVEALALRVLREHDPRARQADDLELARKILAAR